ncbi:hypothetical protein HZA42_04250 [Candidatus Peregrinibacteria bacterium]|nr:hypothetical protein [Candidatus Peregrinibacteria bacterium]
MLFDEELDAIAHQKSDTEFGLKMNEEKAKMLKKSDLLLPQKTLTA